MRMTLQEIAALTGGILSLDSENPQVKNLLTDSRSLLNPPDSLFFALKTGAGDGHRYVAGLKEKGVAGFVLSEEVPGMENANVITVNDTLAALQRLAKGVRQRFRGRMLAITGSRGKTTLKEWIFQLMQPLTSVARSPRSFNSQIGVPLSIWEIEEDTRLAVIEAGISRAGEMERLADIIMPHVVIISSIDEEHDEGFSSHEEKIREKLRLAQGSGVEAVIYNADDADLAEKIAELPSSVKRIGWSRTGKGVLNAAVSEPKEGHAQLEVKFPDRAPLEVSIPYSAPYDIDNALAALAFMAYEGTDNETIASRFRNIYSVHTRLDVMDGVNGCSLIYDSYTSDFASLLPAIDFMRRRADKSLPMTLILSDSQRYPSARPEQYATFLKTARDAGISRIIGIGETWKALQDDNPGKNRFFGSTDEFFSQMSTSDFSDETILIKGAPEFGFGRILEMLQAKTHETVLEVNLDAIVRNYNYFRSHLPASTGLIAMVKASGYGAGSFEVAKTMQDAGAAYLAVAVLDEGIDLRNRGITMPIMVMNPKVLNYKSMFAYRLEPEIYSLDMLRDVIREGEKYGVTGYPLHIKLDTGMHRMGFIKEELPEMLRLVERSGSVAIKSVFSHLATADCPDMDDYTLLQLSRFREYTDYIQGHTRHRVLRHILNSAGILRFPEHHYDMARLGIGLYGVNTLPPEMEKPLSTVSALRTMIIAIRKWGKDETIGYGRKGRLHRDSSIATIPVGYADGMNRHFGNGNIRVRVNGCDAPTVGNICMDACMIDVTGIDCKVGDSVEIFGPEMSVQRLADTLDTIPYEILTSISPRVKRIYFRE